MKRYLFVSGCPRSGTTAMALMLNWAPNCFIGQERFNLLFNKKPFNFAPELFEAERIKEFREDDCGYTSFEAIRDYWMPYANPETFVQLDNALIVGDKLISLYNNFQVLDAAPWAGKDVRVVHIIRDVVEVASSYQARRDNPADGWDANFAAGVREWSESIQKTYDYIHMNKHASAVQIKLVAYESVSTLDIDVFLATCRNIYDFCALDLNKNVLAGLRLFHLEIVRRLKHHNISSELRSAVNELVEPDVLQKCHALRQIAQSK